MDKRERMNEAYLFLKSKGYAHTQRELAEKAGVAEAIISKALKGEDRVLTDSFLRRFNKALGDPFSYDWLLTGEGPMLKDGTIQQQAGENSTQIAGNSNNVNNSATLDKALDEIAEQRKLVATSQGQIDRLLVIIENMTKKE